MGSFPYCQGGEMTYDVLAQRVLVVEDEVLIQDLLRDALKDEGFEVVIAGDAPAALAVLESSACDDLIGLVTDVNLGCASTGWDIARRARELLPTLPIVYISGGSGHEWTAQGVPQSTLVAKPFVPAQIVVALSTLRNRSDSAT